MSFASAFLLLAFAAAQEPQAVPRFERGPCPVEVEAGEKIECGALFVPENREKAGTRTIRLPVMIFKSRSAAPAADPILFMPGGPGNSSVARRRSGKRIAFLDDRDYILLEHRGAQYAQPSLHCPAINQMKGEIAAGRLRGKKKESELVKAAADCQRTLLASGVDLDGYTSAATADDIEDLRKTLGYPKWNLYGLSYGTRVILAVVRKHPGGVRSVILNSVLPPDVHFDEVASANLLRVLHLVFDGCEIDRQCGAAFPDLRRTFAELIAAADRKPIDVGLDGTTVRGSELVEAIYTALHDEEAIPYIPSILDNAARGRYDQLRQLVQSNQGAPSTTYGLRYSVWCSGEMPFEDPERVASQTAVRLGLGGVDERAATPELCRAWNVKPAGAIENEPVKSDVPALIFAGEFDPDTPPDWGRQLLETMPRAKYVEIRGGSHGAGFHPCGVQIALKFLRAPESPLDADCALAIRGADFGLSARAVRPKQ